MKWLSLAILGAFLSGCATPPVAVKGDTYCGIARRITWSVSDTRETIDQVRRSNAKHRRVCG